MRKTNKKKNRAIAGAAFVNRDQVLGGGCNWEVADMQIYHNFSEGFKSGDMLEPQLLECKFCYGWALKRKWATSAQSRPLTTGELSKHHVQVVNIIIGMFSEYFEKAGGSPPRAAHRGKYSNTVRWLHTVSVIVQKSLEKEWAARGRAAHQSGLDISNNPRGYYKKNYIMKNKKIKIFDSTSLLSGNKKMGDSGGEPPIKKEW